MADLETRLLDLGRTMVVPPPPEDLAEQVLRRVAAAAPARAGRARTTGGRPGRWTRALLGRSDRWRRNRRRLVAAIVAALIVALALTPPVRAAVAQWLRIGGVVIKTGPPAGSSPTPLASSSPSEGSLGPPTVTTVAGARSLVTFEVGVPAELGTPDRVEVSSDRRVVSMAWRKDAGQVRLDQFDGTIDWVFVKSQVHQIVPVEVNGADGIWLPRAHEIHYVDRSGIERTETSRIAGPTLLWERPVDKPVTLRLEGLPTPQEATEIAESVQ